MIHYTHCPVCGGASIQPCLTAKDHTVSQEDFAIWRCNSCTVRFTQDAPGPDEIGPYYVSADYVSHSDTRKGFINYLYHLVRKRTLAGKRNLLKRETGLNKGRLLDIGCGTGAFLNMMKETGWAVTGLEPEVNARKKALELYNIQPAEPEKLFGLEPASFDAITLWHVLEHVHDLHNYMQQINKLLAPGGKLFIAVPNYTSYDATVYRECWAAWDVPRHLYHFSPGSIELLFEQNSFRVNAYKPMWFDSFYVSMLSEKYKNGKGNIIRASWNGFVSNLNAGRDKKNCSSVIYVAAVIPS